MFGIKLSSIFKSRWMALLWSAGVCYMAYDFVGVEGEDGAGDATALANVESPVTQEDVNSFKNAF
jgi:hypothetical protein